MKRWLKGLPWVGALFGCSQQVEPKHGTAEEVVAYYKGLGFFAGRDPRDVLAAYEREWSRLPDPSKPWDDIFLLALDKTSVWASDPEADVCAENQVYAEVLSEWASISSGTFQPVDIKERWASETGPVDLSYSLDGTRHRVHPTHLDDWMDLDVLKAINKTIKGRQFAYAVDGNFALVVCLLPDVRERLERDRRVPFAW